VPKPDSSMIAVTGSRAVANRGLVSICVINRLSLLVEKPLQILDACHDSLELRRCRKDHG
jgi:hypothetical protein